MESLLTSKIASLTELRDPAKVLERAGSSPVAIMNRGRCVGYFVPVEAVQEQAMEAADSDRVKASLAKRRSVTQPVLDYLKDK
jgi:antitoxin StbD